MTNPLEAPMPWKQRFNDVFSPKKRGDKTPAMIFLSEQIKRKDRNKRDPTGDGLSRSRLNIQCVFPPPKRKREEKTPSLETLADPFDLGCGYQHAAARSSSSNLLLSGPSGPVLLETRW
jgi:hypothetical protein